jgi:hypothetical protein
MSDSLRQMKQRVDDSIHEYSELNKLEKDALARYLRQLSFLVNESKAIAPTTVTFNKTLPNLRPKHRRGRKMREKSEALTTSEALRIVDSELSDSGSDSN